MKHQNLLIALVCAAAVSGCAPADIASRNAMYDTSSSRMSLLDNLNSYQPDTLLDAVHIQQTNVFLPNHLRVAQETNLLQSADIIWHDAANTDHRDQVRAIFEAAIQQGAVTAYGPVPATLEVEVLRFHNPASGSATDVPSAEFILTVVDARNGKALAEPRQVTVELNSFAPPIAEAQPDNTVLIHDLARAIEQQLSTPGSYKRTKLAAY